MLYCINNSEKGSILSIQLKLQQLIIVRQAPDINTSVKVFFLIFLFFLQLADTLAGKHIVSSIISRLVEAWSDRL